MAALLRVTQGGRIIVSLLLAVAENGVIGRSGRLPWHLPADLRRLESLTTGHTIIMGRKTFESLGRPLPNRRNVILTRNRDYRVNGAEVVHGFDEALQLAQGEDEVFVIGGAEIYRLALPHADRIYLTLVHARVAGDASIPDLTLDQFKIIEDRRHQPDALHEHAYSFRVYQRR